MSNRFISLVSVIAILSSLFIPLTEVKAANPYSVVMVSNSSNNATVGTYATYSAAVTAMNNQNSTSTSVASIYKNGKIINSRYAIFRFYPSASSSETTNLYQNAGDLFAYTYTHRSSMTEMAFIDSNESRAQIMLNGFKGWVNLDQGEIIPISLLGANAVNITASGLRLRSSASTSGSVLKSVTCTNTLFTYTSKVTNEGYTWYKITYNGTTGWVASGTWLKETTSEVLGTYYHKFTNGNLIHKYQAHNGVGYTPDDDGPFSNLGPAPDYMTVGVRYYSFDGGIYLYSTLTSMLDDYRNDTYTHSVNANNPNYPYYLYLPNKSVSKITADQLDAQITNTNSKLYKQGKYFKEAEATYGMNALSSFSTAKNESSNGTSSIAINKNNVFGFGAYDSCPYTCAYSYSSVRDSIMDYAKNGLNSYMIAQESYYFGTHSGTKGSGRNVKYASDPGWGETQASIAYSTDLKVNKRDYLANTIGVTKYGKYNVAVYKDTTSNTIIYRLQNKNSSLKVYNVPVTVIDKIGDYYKVYADSSSYQYGYIKTSDLNVSNSQPVINATDKVIALNSTFNAMDGVSASDRENGNLTSRINYSGTVNTAKAGDYNITYTVTDDSNFSVSKTVKVTVKGASEPVIEASDKEVSQYTEFDYMNGVSAKDDTDGDITSKITYEGTVDTNTKGTYEVTYKVVNSNNKTTTKKIKVTVVDNEKPVIDATDKTINLNSDFDELFGVKATDKEDGDLTSDIKVTNNNVKTDTIGEYTVTYEVTDSASQKVSKTIKVNVVAKTLNKKDGWFHLEKLSFENDKLIITGFNIVSGELNGKDDNIKHKMVLSEQTTGEELSFDLNRWIYNTPFDPSDGTNTIYNGSWFEGAIDLSDIPQGDYTIYIYTETDNSYVKEIVSNIEYTDNIKRKYEDSDSRGYMVKENTVLPTVDLELFVRNDGLISYGTTPVRSGVISDFFDYSFDDNYLTIIGNSYALKTDYSRKNVVDREIVLEDKQTHNIVYRKSIGSSDGPYQITSNTKNDLSQAWFNAKVGLENIPTGNYIIYIKTKSGNVEDYSELSDFAYSDLSSSKIINNKNYKLIRNNNQRIRLELQVK